MGWYVLYVRSRFEIKAAAALEKMGIQTFCPVIKELKQWSDRKKINIKPLFNSYVFVRINEENREQVFEVSGVVRYVYWLGKPAIVSDKEIETIRAWVEDEGMEKIEVSGLTPGAILKLKTGVFKDRDAKIVDVGNNTMRLILLDLGCMITIKVKSAIT